MKPLITVATTVLLPWLGVVVSIAVTAPESEQTNIEAKVIEPVDERTSEGVIVERISAGVIKVTGATYGITSPESKVIHGVPIPIASAASMAWEIPGGGPMIWAVDSRLDYEVRACVYSTAADGTLTDVEWFTVLAPRSRIDKVQRLLEIGIEIETLKVDLVEIDFPEYVAAIRRWQAEQDAVPTQTGAAFQHISRLESSKESNDAKK